MDPVLLAQEMVPSHAQTGLFDFFMTIPWYAWVAIVAIVSGVGGGLLTRLLEHRERMAMIRQGIHPDTIGVTEESKAPLPEI